jgi:hypothetical protein
MDQVDHARKLYARLDAEITAFLSLLAEGAAQHPGKVHQQLERLLETAKQIGGKLLEDVKLLKFDFHRYQIQAESLQKIQDDAMRIKHEVRAL